MPEIQMLTLTTGYPSHLGDGTYNIKWLLPQNAQNYPVLKGLPPLKCSEWSGIVKHDMCSRHHVMHLQMAHTHHAMRTQMGPTHPTMLEQMGSTHHVMLIRDC